MAYFTDNFNRSNGGLGTDWTTINGTSAPQIVSNQASYTSDYTFAKAVYNGSSFSSKHYAEFTTHNTSDGTPDVIIAASNYTNSATFCCYYLRLYYYFQTWEIYRVDNGTATKIHSGGSTTIGAGDTFRLQLKSGVLTAYRNGTSLGTVSDSTYSSGYCGFSVYRIGSSAIDNFVASDILEGSTSSTLAALTSTATGALAIAGTASNTLASLTKTATGALAIAGTGSNTLSALSGSSTGALAISGSLSGTLGALTGSETGTLALAGSASATLGAVSISATAALSIAGAVAQTLGNVTASATGALAIVGAGSSSLADLSITGAGSLAIAGSLTKALGTLTGSGGGAADGVAGALSVSLDALAIVATGSVTSAPEAAAPTTGGWWAYDFYTSRRRRKRDLDELLEQDDALPDIDAQIATILHKQEAIDAERRENERLLALARRYSDTGEVTDRVRAAMVRAQELRTSATLEALARELERMRDEEEISALIVLLNQ